MTPPAAPAILAPDRTPLGVVFMVAFCATAPLLDMFSKLAADNVPVGQITAARFVVQAALLLPVMAWLGLSLRMDGRTVLLTFLRAALSCASTFTFVYAVRVMPIADALAIAFLEPFLLLLIGHFILRERVGGRRLAAAVTGFIGTLMVVRPGFLHFGVVALYPLATAVFFSLYMISTRYGSKGMHPVTLQATTGLAATALLVPVLFLFDGSGVMDFDPIWPEAHDMLWLFGMGAAATIAHQFLTFALRFASSTVLAPLHYLELVAATVIGLIVFGDFPDNATWAGIAVIAASGLYIAHRERVTARAALPLPFDPVS